MQIKIIEFTSVAEHRTGDYNVRGENGKSPDAARNLSFSSIGLAFEMSHRPKPPYQFLNAKLCECGKLPFNGIRADKVIPIGSSNYSFFCKKLPGRGGIQQQINYG